MASASQKEEPLVYTSTAAAWFPCTKVATLNCNGPTAKGFAALRHESVERIIRITARNGVDFILVQELKGLTATRAVKEAADKGYSNVQGVGRDTDANIFYNSAKYEAVPVNLTNYWNAIPYTSGCVAEIGVSRMSVGFFKYRASNPASATAKDYFIMVVSWHGPQSMAKSLEKKREYFENLMITIDMFRVRFATDNNLFYDDVPVILGGDFNVEKKDVWPMKAALQHDLEFITCTCWSDYDVSHRRMAKKAGFQRIDDILFIPSAQRARVMTDVQSLYLEDPKPIKGFISDTKETSEDMDWLKKNYLSLDHDPLFSVIKTVVT